MCECGAVVLPGRARVVDQASQLTEMFVDRLVALSPAVWFGDVLRLMLGQMTGDWSRDAGTVGM